MRRRWMYFLVVLLFAISVPSLPAANFPQDETQIVESDVDVVSVYFTVRDSKKRLVSRLDQQQFRVLEDDQEQPIKFFAHHSEVMLNVGVLLDTGTNMKWMLGREAAATSMFLKRVVRPTDLGFILSYHSRVETIQPPTSDTALLQEKVDAIRSWGTAADVSTPAPTGTPWPLPGSGPTIGPFPGNGPTIGPSGPRLQLRREAHLYDAIFVATQRYLQREVGRKAVVIVALSGDSRSESTLEDALQVLLQNDVIAYVLQIYDPPHPRPGYDPCDVNHTYERDRHGEEVLNKLAEATGGRMLQVRGMDKLETALEEISEELHHQYSLGYYPQNQNWDGKFRKIRIMTQEKGFKVFARKGYYAQPRNRASR